MKSSSDVLLRVANLRTIFPIDGGDAAAVDDVSFDVRRGETLALVGESGSGKSITALSIIRLVPAPGRIAGGHVDLDGRNLFNLRDEEMRQVRGRRIGFVFQEPMIALDPVYTIGYQIAETIAAHGMARGEAAKRRAIEMLDAVRMPEPARRAGEYAHQLSGGLRQRAMMALALCAEPSLLIADEPTTALDVSVQAEILELLRDLRRTLQLSVLLITHDLGIVATMADRVAVMYAGRIVEQSPVDRLFTTPAHPYTRGLLAAIPGQQPGRLVTIPGTVPPLGRRTAGCAFEPRCDRRMAICARRTPATTTIAPEAVVRCFLHEPQ